MIDMNASILDTIKKMVGIAKEDTFFDTDIVMHTNSTFAELNQIGCGPEEGFMIEDQSAVWSDYVKDNKLLNFVVSYMALKVKLLFDPPASSTVLQAMERQADKYEWRINVLTDHPAVLPDEGEFQNE